MRTQSPPLALCHLLSHVTIQRTFGRWQSILPTNWQTLGHSNRQPSDMLVLSRKSMCMPWNATQHGKIGQILDPIKPEEQQEMRETIQKSSMMQTKLSTIPDSTLSMPSTKHSTMQCHETIDAPPPVMVSVSTSTDQPIAHAPSLPASATDMEKPLPPRRHKMRHNSVQRGILKIKSKSSSLF